MVKSMTKEELIMNIKSERARWDGLVAALNEGQMVQSGVVGQWSVKDLISHLTAWESRPIAWLKAVHDGTLPQSAPWSPDLSDDDQINEWIWQTHRARPLEQVIAESRKSYEELMNLLEATSEEDLITAQRFSWATADTIAGGIPGNTYEHYQEHAVQVRDWLEKRVVAEEHAG